MPAGKGVVELTISPLPSAAILSSLNAEGTEGIRVLTTRFRSRPVVQDNREDVAKLQDELAQLATAREKIEADVRADPGEPQDARQDGRLHGREHDSGHGEGGAQRRGSHHPGQVRQGFAAGRFARAGQARAGGEGQSGQGRGSPEPDERAGRRHDPLRARRGHRGGSRQRRAGRQGASRLTWSIRRRGGLNTSCGPANRPRIPCRSSSSPPWCKTPAKIGPTSIWFCPPPSRCSTPSPPDLQSLRVAAVHKSSVPARATNVAELEDAGQEPAQQGPKGLQRKEAGHRHRPVQHRGRPRPIVRAAQLRYRHPARLRPGHSRRAHRHLSRQHAVWRCRRGPRSKSSRWPAPSWRRNSTTNRCRSSRRTFIAWPTSSTRATTSSCRAMRPCTSATISWAR